MTGTGALGACPLAWASGDIVLVATHTDETRSFRQDGPLEVPFVSDMVRGVLEGVRCLFFLRSPICFWIPEHSLDILDISSSNFSHFI